MKVICQIICLWTRCIRSEKNILSNTTWSTRFQNNFATGATHQLISLTHTHAHKHNHTLQVFPNFSFSGLNACSSLHFLQPFHNTGFPVAITEVFFFSWGSSFVCYRVLWVQSDGSDIRSKFLPVSARATTAALIVTRGGSRGENIFYKLHLRTDILCWTSVLIEDCPPNLSGSKLGLNYSRQIVIWVWREENTHVCAQVPYTVQALTKPSYLLWWAFVSGCHGDN